jgi:hypothetical protein
MRILVTPEKLRAMAQQFRSASTQLDSVGSRVSHAYSRIDAEARSAANVGGRVRQAQLRALSLANEAEAMARYLERKAQEFEEADRTGLAGLHSIDAVSAAFQSAVLAGVAGGLIQYNRLDAHLRLGGLNSRQSVGLGAPVTSINRQVTSLSGIPRAIADTTTQFFNASVDRMITTTDPLVNQMLTTLLPKPPKDTTESMAFKLKGDVTLPGIEVGVPGSFKIPAGSTITVTRDDKGFYTLTIEQAGGVGLREDLISAEGGLHVGDKKYKVGPDIGVEATAEINGSMSYRFDPNERGDMTKMALLLSRTGAPLPLAGLESLAIPALFNVSANLQSFKAGTKASASGNVDIYAIKPVAGAELKIEAGNGMSFEKTEDGNVRVSQYVSLAADGKVSVLDKIDRGVRAETTLEQIVDTQGKESTRVTVEVSTEKGAELTIDKLEKYIPKTALEKIKIKGNEEHSITVEYTLDHPAETVKQTLLSARDGLNLQPLLADAEIKVSTTSKVSLGLGAETKVGGVSQSVGLNGDVEVVRSNERTVFFKHKDEALPSENPAVDALYYG